MYDNYHYPLGADTPDAPWNQEEVPDEDFEITCSQSLSKTVTVTTNNYIPGASGVDYERDDEGGTIAIPYHEDPDTSDTNWEDEFKGEHYTPLQIISKCEELCKYLLERDMTDYGKNSLTKLLNECSGWTNDETEFVEN